MGEPPRWARQALVAKEKTMFEIEKQRMEKQG